MLRATGHARMVSKNKVIIFICVTLNYGLYSGPFFQNVQNSWKLCIGRVPLDKGIALF